MGTRALADELHKRGMLPPHCQKVEIIVGVNTVLYMRYEVAVEADDLAKVADAMKTVAESQQADDERNRLANLKSAS